MVDENAMVVCPACGDRPACPQCGRVRRQVQFCAMCGAALAGAPTPGPDSAPPQPAMDCEVSPADLDIDAEEQALLELINQHRALHGKEALSFGKPALNRAAAWLSRDMATNNYLGHTDSRGRTLDRLSWCGANFTTAAENVAAGPADAPSVFALWKDSAEHDANMLRDGVRFAGIARAYNADAEYGWYWTLDVTD